MGQLWMATKKKHRCEMEEHLCLRIDQRPNGTNVQPILKHQIERLHQVIVKERRGISRRKADNLKERLIGPGVEKEAYRLVRDAPLPAMLFVKTDEGTITAKPDEVDATVIKSWSQVYKGNHDDQIEFTSMFYRGTQTSSTSRQRQPQ